MERRGCGLLIATLPLSNCGAHQWVSWALPALDRPSVLFQSNLMHMRPHRHRFRCHRYLENGSVSVVLGLGGRFFTAATLPRSQRDGEDMASLKDFP